MSVIFEPLTGQLLQIPSLVFPGTLVIASGKTFTVNNTLTLAGTDGTTMTFPSTSATLARTDASQTFTGSQTIAALVGPVTITEAVGSSGLTVTGATQTSSFPALNITQTWNASGTTFTAAKVNVTNTAAASTSLLLDLQIGSSTVLSIDRAAKINTAGTSIQFSIGGTRRGFFASSPNEFNLEAAVALGWNEDVYVIRDGANILAQRNATSAQNHRIYNTFTTVNTAGEWFKQDWITTANQFRFGAAKGSSTGTARVASWDYGGTEASPVAAITVPITSGSVVFGGGITLADAGDIVINTTTGTKIGTATSQKIGFYNATPVIQRADMSALIDSTTGTPGLTLGDVGVVFSQSAINNNFSSVLTQINKVRTALRDLGLMA